MCILQAFQKIHKAKMFNSFKYIYKCIHCIYSNQTIILWARKHPLENDYISLATRPFSFYFTDNPVCMVCISHINNVSI